MPNRDYTSYKLRKCDFCSKRFRYKKKLINHMATHASEHAGSLTQDTIANLETSASDLPSLSVSHHLEVVESNSPKGNVSDITIAAQSDTRAQNVKNNVSLTGNDAAKHGSEETKQYSIVQQCNNETYTNIKKNLDLKISQIPSSENGASTSIEQDLENMTNNLSIRKSCTELKSNYLEVFNEEETSERLLQNDSLKSTNEEILDIEKCSDNMIKNLNEQNDTVLSSMPEHSINIQNIISLERKRRLTTKGELKQYPYGHKFCVCKYCGNAFDTLCKNQDKENISFEKE